MPATRHLLPQLLLLPLTALASGCSLMPSVPTTPLEVPSHDADDPRTKTGGFVRQVRLAEVEQDGTKYILMAWRVGDVLTLGAMTQGGFEGDVHWQIDGAELRFPAEQQPDSRDVAVTATGAPPGAAGLAGETAGFRDFRWTNIELHAPDWLSADTFTLALTFRTKAGATVRFPARGHYAAQLVAR